MDSDNKSFDVAVIGAGMTGMSTVYHLLKSGLRNLVVLDSGINTASYTCPAVIRGGFPDNYTRLTHAFGHSDARSIWRFGDLALERLRAFLVSEQIPHQNLSSLRLAASLEEEKEMHLAIGQLKADGFDVRQGMPPGKAESEWEAFRLTQVENIGALYVDFGEVAQHLGASSSALTTLQDSVHTLDSGHNGVSIRTRAGRVIDAEFVVLACHFRAKSLVSSLEDVLVPYADQWSEIRTSRVGQLDGLDPYTFAANFRLEWGAFLGDSVVLGGGRYLRKFAGIGAEEAAYQPKIAAHLRALAEMRFPSWKFGSTIREHALVGCSICDEMPLIGPLPGNERIMIATGYMGNGLAMAFTAGSCLADMINQGRSKDLPAILEPRRLRSLHQ